MSTSPAVAAEPTAGGRLWRPRQVLITRSAREHEHGRAIAARGAALGVPVVALLTDRLNLDLPDNSRGAYAEAKATLRW